MTSTHHHHPRFTTPQQISQNERRLPSIKDLNFQYRSPQGSFIPHPQSDPPTSQQQETPRHSSAWASRVSNHQQQHTPPLSAGHEVPKELEYPSKQENGGYAHPGLPLSAQATPLPGAVNIGNPRGDDPPHSPNQLKRSRTASTNVSVPRDIRPSHTTYPQPQYASYPPASQPPTSTSYAPIPSGLPAQTTHAAPPPQHDQMQHHPMAVSAHPGYPYQHPYMQTRQPIIHPQHPSQSTHSNPYPSPGPPPSAPPPQGPWGQTHPQQQHPQQPTSHQLPPPPPPQQQHAQHQSHMPPPHQQPPMSSAPSHMVHHHHNHPHQNSHPPIQHHSLQQQPPQQQQQQQFQPQQQQLSFARTTAIVPTTVDTRGPYAVNEPERHPSTRNDTLMEIAHRCLMLHQFASRYAQQPHVQPSASELEEMSQHALTVVRLLEELQRLNFSDGEEARIEADPMHQSPDDPRPPKRPWEDISQEGVSMPDPNSFVDQYPSTESKPQTTAEQDMELIRTKRATSTAGANGSVGQPKSKYRKRSRATPPGKCHSCNIRETPEWRRGPDGARTLCNACGLHYAKLMRKRDKNGPNGEAPHIDLETLRASARAADIATAEKAQSRSAKQSSRSHQQSEPTSPMNAAKQPPQHHEGSFQLVNMMAPDPSSSATMSTDTGRAPPLLTQQPSMAQPSAALPPPPWSTNPAPPSVGSGTRPYAQPDHIQQQSFMRSSQHSSVNHAPTR